MAPDAVNPCKPPLTTSRSYLTVWILLALFVPAIRGVVLLEERELRQRFGEQYEQYSREVPRFVPRFVPRWHRNPTDRSETSPTR